MHQEIPLAYVKTTMHPLIISIAATKNRSTLHNLLNILSWDLFKVLKLIHCFLELLMYHEAGNSGQSGTE